MRAVADAFKQGKNARLARLIYLYAIRYDAVANLYLWYTSYGKPITFQGNEYTPYVIAHDKIEENLSGNVSSLNLEIANANRNIQAIHDNYGLIDKQVTIYTVAEEELTDPNAYTSDEFYITNLTTSKPIAVMLLKSAFDVMDIRVPKRYFFRAYCRFRFKDSNCQYSGGQNDCNKTLQRCRELNNTTRFGAFPSIPVQNLLYK